MRSVSTCLYTACVLSAGTLLEARASGFQITAQNASGLGSVYAGQAAVADDASAVWFNPAELTRLGPGLRYAGAVEAITPASTFSDGGSCAPYLGTGAGTSSCPFGRNGNLGHTPGGEGGRSSTTRAVPALYLSGDVLPGTLWAGFAFNVPFGLETKYESSWIGRFHSIESKTEALNFNGALAWKVAEPLSLALGVDAQRFSARLSNAVSYRAVALASGVPALIAAVGPGAEGVATLKGSDWGYGFNAGADLALGDDLHVGLTYRSAIRHTLDGHVTFADRPAALSSVGQVADGGARVSVRLPATTSLAVQWTALPKVELLGDITHLGWSVIQDLPIERSDGDLAGTTLNRIALRLKNTVRVGAGAAWQVRDDVSLRAGVSHETSSVQDAYRTPLLPDSPRWFYGVGGRYRFQDRSTLDVGAAWVRAKRPPIALANQDSATSAPVGSLVGNASTSVSLFGVQYSGTLSR